ncbi:MAG: hypothetical protein ABEJ65_08840 [bacterium]
MTDVELRSFVYLDKLQSQFASFMAKSCKSDIPTAGMASLFVEIQPGIEINRVADVAMKQTGVRPARQIEEREYGILELHHEEQEEVRYAGQAILDEFDLEFSDRIPPEDLSTQIIHHVTPYHAQVVNKGFDGSMLVEGETLFIFEVQPAVNIVIAANEAEKATNIKLVHFRYRGRFGRLYLSGSEDQAKAARDAACNAFEDFKQKKTF